MIWQGKRCASGAQGTISHRGGAEDAEIFVFRFNRLCDLCASVVNHPPQWSGIALALLTIVLLVACGPMRDQPSIRPQQAPRLDVPAGAVPVNGLMPQYDLAQAQGIANPVAGAPESLKAGQSVFETYCVMCHGEDGKGSGPVGRYFDPPPADLTAGFMAQISDGQLFVMITNGVGRMPPFQDDLTEEQRWQVVDYLRTLPR